MAARLAPDEGVLTWHVPIGGVSIPAVTIDLTLPDIARVDIVMKTQGMYTLEIVTKGVFDPAKAAAVVGPVKDRFLGWIAVKLGGRVYEEQFVGYCLPHPPNAGGAEGKYQVGREVHMPTGGPVYPPRQITQADVIGLGKTVMAASSSGDAAVITFRVGSAESNPVSAFVHLYNVLLQVCGDSQPDVDEAILAEDATTPQTPSPRFLGRMETVYTRLRNEINHDRPGTDLRRTGTEIETALPQFEKIVRGIVSTRL